MWMVLMDVYFFCVVVVGNSWYMTIAINKYIDYCYKL
jgi:hypothetical protein